MTSGPVWVWTWLRLISSGSSRAIAATGGQDPPTAHGPDAWRRQELLPVMDMACYERLGQQALHRAPDEFGASISEHIFCAGIDQHNAARSSSAMTMASDAASKRV